MGIDYNKINWESKEEVLKLVKEYGFFLEFVSEKLRGDKEVVLAAVKKEGWNLQYASEELRADREIVLEAVRNGGCALEYASEILKNDREIVLIAIQEEPYAFRYASEELRGNIDIVYEAIQRRNKMAYFISDKLLSSLVIGNIEEDNTIKNLHSIPRDIIIKNPDILLHFIRSIKEQELAKLQKENADLDGTIGKVEGLEDKSTKRPGDDE